MNTGGRRGELQKLQWSDVDFSGDRITVRAATAKASKTRHISLNRIAREALAQWRKQNPDAVAVFGKVDNKKAMATLLDDAGLSRFRPNHDFRHHFEIGRASFRERVCQYA